MLATDELRLYFVLPLDHYPILVILGRVSLSLILTCGAPVSSLSSVSMASADRSLPVTEIETPPKNRRPGRSPSHLAHLDIGTFSSVALASVQKIAERRSDKRFHFLR